MRVLYDYQIFIEQKFGGISRYFFELMKGLQGYDDIIISDFNIYLSGSDYAKELEQCKLNIWREFTGRKDLARFINKTIFKKVLQSEKYDIYHPTYYNWPLVSHCKNKPLVITIHDMIDEKFHTNIPSLQNLIEQRKRIVNRADKIIAVSESTRNDIIEAYGIKADKISVVYHGNSLNTISSEQAELSIKQRSYILFIGNRKGIHKNFTNLVKATVSILKKENLKLVCGGGGDFTEKEKKIFYELGLENSIS
ncbi:MAG: glycosyltransferase, partial [Bacteroidota bacterium]|nr:glycosyltransferase [Bacteroidota bacterium]